MVKETRISDIALGRRLLWQARPYWIYIAGCFLLSLLATPLTLLTPLPLKIAVDSVLGSHPLPGFLAAILPGWENRSAPLLLALTACLLIVITLLLYLQSLGAWLLQTYTGEKLSLIFRARIFRHVQRLSLTYHDVRGTADSTYRIQYDAPSIQHVIISGFIPLISALSTLAAMIYVTARFDLTLALLAMSVSAPLYMLNRSFSPRLRRKWKEVKKSDSSAMSVVQEVLSAVRVVKAFGREEYEQERFMRDSSERVRGQLRVAFLQGTLELLIGLVLALGTALTLFLGIQHVRAQILTLGELLLIMAYLAQIYEPLKTMSKKIADIQGGLASAERAFALLDELPEVAERADARPLVRSSGAVSFQHVTFAYNGERPVIHGISLDVAPGSRVGIQGCTGAGKTTLVSLLTRFYDPTEGRILLDGHDIREYRLSDLRNQFALVLQDAVLFSTSIAENIAYGRPGATKDEIVEAARLANAHAFVSQLPSGYETLVGERGMLLSGGERQRISLARAFLKDAPILLLDEPTSSVDMKTESEIFEALELLMKNRTTFIIAHRLTTLDNCDVRLLIENGQLQELHA